MLSVRQVHLLRRRPGDSRLEHQLDAEPAGVPHSVFDELWVAASGPPALRAVELGEERLAGCTITIRHSSRRIRGNSRFVSRSTRSASSPASSVPENLARDEEREQPAALFLVWLDIGELEHLDDPVLQAEAVVEVLEPERVLGEAG